MRARIEVLAVAVILVQALGPGPAAAQPIEMAGVRALGMAGAFVAVADDATAVYWNPAGLAKGPFLGLAFETTSGDLDPAADQQVPETSARASTLVALTVPSLGVSYYRSRLIRAPAVGSGALLDTDDLPAEPDLVSSLTAHQLGLTVLQSLSEGFIVGSTVKWVRGVAAAGPLGPVGDNEARLDQARSLEGLSANEFDLDVGALAVFGKVRLGVVGRNLLAPEFEAPDGTRLGLETQVRAGVAVEASPAILVAADVDLRQTTDVDGARRRRLSVGAEARLTAFLAVRGGLGVALTGGARTVGAGGASVALGRFWLDGHVMRGEHGDTGWSVGLRFAY